MLGIILELWIIYFVARIVKSSSLCHRGNYSNIALSAAINATPRLVNYMEAIGGKGCMRP